MVSSRADSHHRPRRSALAAAQAISTLRSVVAENDGWGFDRRQVVPLIPGRGQPYQLREITPILVEDFREQMTRAKVGAPTQRKALMVLQGILRRAVVRGLTPVNPAQLVDKPVQRPTQLPQPLAPGDRRADPSDHAPATHQDRADGGWRVAGSGRAAHTGLQLAPRRSVSETV